MTVFGQARKEGRDRRWDFLAVLVAAVRFVSAGLMRLG
jgi:hypothetical protein